MVTALALILGLAAPARANDPVTTDPAPAETTIPTSTVPAESTVTTVPEPTTSVATESTTTVAAAPTATPTTVASAATTATTLPSTPPATNDAPVVAALETNGTVSVEKTAAVPGGGPVTPGTTFTYQLYVACSSITVDCVGFVFTDVIPEGLEIVQLPTSNPTRTVNYNAGTRTLTMTYQQPTNNPVGTGWTSGSNEAFDIVVRLPTSTDRLDGETITNTGTVTAAGLDPLSDTADVTVDIPVVVRPTSSKTWAGSGVVAGSDAVTGVTIGAANDSSTSAEVTSLSVTDVTPATWEHFDLAAPPTLTALPQGATQAQLFVCTKENSVCGESDWIAGGIAIAPGGPLTPPIEVAAGNVTGLRVVFTAGGATIPRAPLAGGIVDFDVALRDTLRSTGTTIAPTANITVNNCVTASASEAGGAPVTSTPACATKQIWPSNVSLTAAKAWFADTNGNWSNDGGEYAVAGHNSPVTARVSATNNSPFPIHQIVITEPGTGATGFSRFDVDKVRLTFPTGATTARVEVTYDTGSPSDTNHAAPAAPATTLEVALDPARQPTSIKVTYTGGTAAAPAIAAGGVARLEMHGAITGSATVAETLTNCAAVAANGATGTTPATANPCVTLPLQAPNVSASGTKSSSQASVPADQPFTFTTRLTNNGNLALINPIFTDPADPMAATNPFNSLRLTAATVTASPSGLTSVLEVTTDGSTWTPYASPVPATVIGVRARVVGELRPTGWVQLNLTVERRAGVADNGASITNCVGATADNQTGTGGMLSNVCATVTSDAPSGAATIGKNIVADSLPQWTPGLARQETGVELRIANTGNLSAQYLEITDAHPAFFDNVDFVRFGTITAPAGANRVQIDALVGATWHTGAPTVVGSPVLPTGVAAADVSGLRFTFTSTSTTNGGFVLTPCAGGVAAACAGVVRFDVSPLADSTLVSPVTDQATGNVLVRDSATPTPKPTNTATDSFELVPGSPRLDVDKGPNSLTMGPGTTALQTLTVTNNGSVWIDDVSVIDLLPAGLAYDEAHDSGDGNPYAVSVTGLPTGYTPAPAPTVHIVRDGERVDSVRWTFAGWSMPPNAVIAITIPVMLEPGAAVGQPIVNTMGSTGTSGNPNETLACTSPDGTAIDHQDFGDGVYCTDTAGVTVIAGAAFQARKWVAGDAALGWWHPTNGFVPTGDASCPSITSGAKQYTATPCVALVTRGGQYDYILRVVNAGTEAATRMALVDNLPHQGDSGLIGGAARDTEWNNRPTLAGAATYSGPATATLAYSSAAAGTWCTDDLQLGGPGCAAGTWADTPGASTTALRLLGDFSDAPLAPGAGIEIRFAMNVPTAIAQDSEVTIAWNSFAHAEATQTALGTERILPPIEPIKVGVSPMLLAKVSVGDFVWVDTDRDGRQDPGEPGIGGVRLTITAPGGGPVTDVFGNPVGPTLTDANGLYTFENLPVLPAGQSYTVHIDPASPPLAPYVPTLAGVGDRAGDSSTGSATSGDLTVDGDRDPTLDFGFVLPKVSVGDFVWVDTDRDGRQDAGEPGIPGVVLVLVGPGGEPVTDVLGNPVGPATTDANGLYTFDNLPVLTGDQTYTVRIDRTASATALAPYIPTTAGVGDRVGDSSTWEAATVPGDLYDDGDRDPTLDFGFVLPKVSVGDFVWVDTDRDGRQDPGEPGIGGVRLTITAPGGGPVTDVFGNPVGPTLTDANGLYLFESLPVLPAGQSYTVHIDPASPPLAPYVPTLAGVGDRAGDSSTGSATSGDLTVDGAHDPTLDFGFVLREGTSPVVPGPGGNLPTTGSTLGPILAAAGIIFALGLLTLFARRRAGIPTPTV